MTTILQQLEYTVESYENGKLAWEAFQKDPASIVITDWLMPEMDGLAFTRNIRKLPREEYTYVVLLTANDSSEDNYYQAMAAGVDDFLQKPLDREKLWSRLNVAKRILSYTHRINQLEAMLPICSYCKKIRDGEAYWKQVEEYMAEQTGQNFSHSICPDCYDKVVKPQLDELKKKDI